MNNNQTKNELRKIYRSIRYNISKDLSKNTDKREKIYINIEEKIKIILNNIQQKNIYVSCYYPVQSELDCLKIFKNVLNHEDFNYKIKLCLPKVIEGERILKFYEYQNEASLMIGKYKIKEPDSNICKEVLPNIIITPLLAFDKYKNRLGYGMGYFDNTFNFLKSINHNFISVGMAFDEQLYDKELPVDEYDCKIDYLITPTKLI